MNIRILCSLILLVAFYGVTNSQTVIIIVNPENPVSDISSDGLKHIFTAERTVWDDGNSIEIVDWKSESKVKVQFYTKMLRKSPAVVRRGWIQKIVAGSIYPPSVFLSEEEIINFVALHRWAIAYVERKPMPPSVKVINVDGYTPDDPEYRLK
ncbi:MAG: hypothetical protein HYV29_00365 [Ignavibacteriales bacterium]|nr:hypothetical protein [Ignavibacteriales bacterium]